MKDEAYSKIIHFGVGSSPNNYRVKDLFDLYDCSFNISRKKYCTSASDCFEKGDLEGCQKADCNWCCYNACTLIGCMGDWDYELENPNDYINCTIICDSLVAWNLGNNDSEVYIPSDEARQECYGACELLR